MIHLITTPTKWHVRPVLSLRMNGAQKWGDAVSIQIDKDGHFELGEVGLHSLTT